MASAVLSPLFVSIVPSRDNQCSAICAAVGLFPFFHLAIKLKEVSINIVADASELVKHMFVGASCLGRILITHVNLMLHVAVKDRAGLLGVIADRDDVVPILVEVFIHFAGGMIADVDSTLTHHHNRLGIDPFFRSHTTRIDHHVFTIRG